MSGEKRDVEGLCVSRYLIERSIWVIERVKWAVCLIDNQFRLASP